MTSYPYPVEEGRRDIILSIIFTILTCGIYGLYWQYKQMECINAWLRREEYDFWKVFFLSIITCGVYYVYTKYKMAESINAIQRTYGFNVNTSLPLITILLSIFGMSLVADAIQQSEMNDWYVGA